MAARTLMERKHKRSERLALLLACAMQSEWADALLPREDDTPASDAERQRKHQFMIAARKVAPHLDLEISFRDSDLHALWDAARILLRAGPLVVTKREADFMRLAVHDVACSAKLYRSRKQYSRRRRAT